MTQLYDDEIEISTYESAPWRSQRLERIVGYVCALGEHFGNSALLSKIAKLHALIRHRCGISAIP